PSGVGWTKRDFYFVGVTDPAGVTVDAAGDVYGTAQGAGLGNYGGGYIFELSTPGVWNFDLLHGFAKNTVGKFAQGYNPDSTPVFDKAGNLYGTTQYNGVSINGGNVIGGTAFKLTPGKKGWKFQLLHTFNGKKDGAQPIGPLVVDSSRNVYGTTYAGGTGACQGLKSYCGTIFELSPKPTGTGYTETVLWNFNNTDGQHPTAGVILDKAGNLYGTTEWGGTGTWANGVVFEVIP
ncbi:MAG: choice-of-anchor tandem repeat GloVer-containing protein, partial [Terriglobales bacterium]